MLLLLVLSLTVFGVRGEYDCDTPLPHACPVRGMISEESSREYRESGDTLPSDEYFKENCESIVDHVKCVKDYVNQCQTEELSADPGAAYESVVEFCNEDSALRKGYAAHVGCFNGIDFESSTCWNSAQDRLRRVGPGFKTEKETKIHCLYFYVLSPCINTLFEETCGEAASQVAADIENRINNVFDCREDEEELYEELASQLVEEVIEKLD